MSAPTWIEKDKARERFLQRLGDEIVRREVSCCVSQLVADLAELEPDSEELMGLAAPTCQTCEGTGGMDTCGDCGGTGPDCRTCDGKKLVPTQHRVPDESCDDCGGEGRFEAFEFWVVSGWLARELRKQGEHVEYDLHGLTVWARCTTGQAIAIDGCIRSIVAETWKDELAKELEGVQS